MEGGPSDDAEDNLALLCFTCHDDVTAKRGLRVRLDNATIRLFRDHHYRSVAFHRGPARSQDRRAAAGRDPFATMLDAVQVAAIRSTSARLDPTDWKQVHALVSELIPYASEQGSRVRAEVLEEASRLASRVRLGMPFNIIQLLTRVTEIASVQGMPWSTRVRKPPAEEVQLLEFGASIGAAVAFDGARRLADLAVVDEGTEVLWLTLRCASMNNLRKSKARLHELFEQARDSARHASSGPFKDAVRWLDFKEADALALDCDQPPQLPLDLQATIDATRQRHRSTPVR